MGNSPTTDLGGTELHDRRDQEVVETKDERPNYNEKIKPKSKDDESSNSKPLQLLSVTPVKLPQLSNGREATNA